MALGGLQFGGLGLSGAQEELLKRMGGAQQSLFNQQRAAILGRAQDQANQSAAARGIRTASGNIQTLQNELAQPGLDDLGQRQNAAVAALGDRALSLFGQGGEGAPLGTKENPGLVFQGASRTFNPLLAAEQARRARAAAGSSARDAAQIAGGVVHQRTDRDIQRRDFNREGRNFRNAVARGRSAGF